MAVNPNWPTLFAEGEFGINPFYAGYTTLVYTDLTPRLYQAWSVHRGRQFELDQVQPGQWTGQLRNRDGFLDPTNASSPLASNVLPYRGYRLRAQYPPSINLLTADVATGGDATPLAAGTSSSSVTSFYGTPVIAASASAWQGSQVWQLAVAGGAPTVNNLIAVTAAGVGPLDGSTYTWTMHVRSVTTGANPSVQPFTEWVDPLGNVLQTVTGTTVALTGSPTAAWTTITLTVTMQTLGAKVGGIFGLRLLATAPASLWSFQADGLQWERNASASTFSTPGTNYPIYSGLAERYPQSWMSQGTYGLVAPVGVDVFAPLSQTLLKEAFIMDVAATSPTWFYPLNDASGSTTFAEQAGRYPAAGLFSSANGAGTLTVGNSITATTTAGKFLGTNGPIVSINNPSQNQGTVVDLTPAGITSAPSTGAWTRMIAFRSTMTAFLPVIAAYTAGTFPGATGFTSNMYLDLQVTSGTNMTLVASFYNAAGQNFGVTHTAVVNDGNWHLAFVQMSADGKTITLWVDGVSVSATGANDMHPTLAVNESIGGDEYKLASTVGYGGSNYTGDIAHYAQWNSALPAFTIQSLYTSWRSAWQGDSTDARYSRILTWAGYLGGGIFGAGNTTSLGPATDVSGVDALTALNNVVNTEAGRHFVAADGTVTFQSRKTQFANTTPMWTFGENNGEIPYTDLRFDYDPTHLSNSVAVTQTTTNQTFNVISASSQTTYGPRYLTRNSQATSTTEVQQSAYYWLAKYSQPALRVAAIRIDVGANPALFPSVLAFEIGQRIRINRRDATGLRPTITSDGFIEQIAHSTDGANSWTVDLEVSPAPANPYGIFTTLATTLHAGSSSGTNTISINPLPDAATNPAAANLTGGQQLTIGSGANLEVVTIAAGGVQATSPGYTSATITLTANLAHTHSTGESVQADASPQYYNASTFDSAQFCF